MARFQSPQTHLDLSERVPLLLLFHHHQIKPTLARDQAQLYPVFSTQKERTYRSSRAQLASRPPVDDGNVSIGCRDVYAGVPRRRPHQLPAASLSCCGPLSTTNCQRSSWSANCWRWTSPAPSAPPGSTHHQSASSLPARWDPPVAVISHLQPRSKNVSSDFDRIEQALAAEAPSSRSSTAAARGLGWRPCSVRGGVLPASRRPWAAPSSATTSGPRSPATTAGSTASC
ncbi:hypothetical protein GQ55_9G006800 [Panicum hallii var. hallii]|uniref:Uncharacterized protein n=1 Tax=Panicum hallii var. hallii TaxID=1504633 RepID=A0A2T7BY54_9POAL|nr:hypothetical protein GQ55_9G006800 [Panicum hallii var. hallii]